MRDEQQASYLLDLYQQVWQAGELAGNNSLEATKLKLANLVIQRNGKLQVYNPIYRAVFDADWIERSLQSLRPYSEAIRGWLASGKQDDAWLLQGNVLAQALEWTQWLKHSNNRFGFTLKPKILKSDKFDWQPNNDSNINLLAFYEAIGKYKPGDGFIHTNFTFTDPEDVKQGHLPSFISVHGDVKNRDFISACSTFFVKAAPSSAPN